MNNTWPRSFMNPVNLAMLAAAILAGLISGWWLAPIGILLYLLMVINLATTPEQRISQQMETRPPVPNRFSAAFDSIERSERRLFNTLAASSARVQRILRPVQKEAADVVSQAHGLCMRVAAMENYRLLNQNLPDLREELKRMETMVKLEKNESKRASYEEQRALVAERITRIEGMNRALDRVDAMLAKINSEVDIAVAEVTRLQALDPGEMEREARGLVERLRQREAEIEELRDEVLA